MNEDPALLRRFTDENSDAAFRELVERRIDFVYATALRQVGGDVHLAREVAQSVFLDLARKARTLAARPNLTGWLYTSVRFAAAKALRSRSRRLNHETEAHAMQEILSAPSATEANWNELRPVLDEAMHELNESDREAILLRYFDNRSFAQVGAAVGLAENSARMRVDRALEKLRARLAHRGITSTAAALSAALATQPAVAAPAGLAASVAGAALATAWANGTSALGIFMGTKLKIGVLCALMSMGIGAYLLNERKMEAKLAEAHGEMARQTQEIAALRVENDRLKREGRTRIQPAGPISATAQAAAPRNVDAQAAAVAQQRRAILQNLRELAKAREQFVMENGRPPASLADLVGPTKYVWKLNPVDGEDYGTLQFGDGKAFSVTTASGITVSVVTNSTDSHGRLIPGTAGGMAVAPSAELLTAITSAVDAFRQRHEGENPPLEDWTKLLPYFQTPKDAADYVDWIETGGSR